MNVTYKNSLGKEFKAAEKLQAKKTWKEKLKFKFILILFISTGYYALYFQPLLYKTFLCLSTLFSWISFMVSYVGFLRMLKSRSYKQESLFDPNFLQIFLKNRSVCSSILIFTKFYILQLPFSTDKWKKFEGLM